MITINQLKLNINHKDDDLKNKILKILNLKEKDLISFEIIKRSLDTRQKNNFLYVYCIDAKVKNEDDVLNNINKKNYKKNVVVSNRPEYKTPSRDVKLDNRPVIAGSGPAGLFCALELAKAGLKPIIIERGKKIDERKKDIEKFWKENVLDENSNVQFGEGGAGTFSDGKLNSRIKDKEGIARYVLKTFVTFGADREIVYDCAPHIGTDKLEMIIKNIRTYLEERDVQILFNTCLVDIKENNNILEGIYVKNTQSGEKSFIKTKNLILAIGHSARDTFKMLYDKKVKMQEKSFACGFRIMHPQSIINYAAYKDENVKKLPVAQYKLSCKSDTGRGVYTFCMCPGGYVVNASSEKYHLAINGMSYNDRNSEVANSAIVVTITPEDYKHYNKEGIPSVLNGVNFQREIENKTYKLCDGRVPIQLFRDFKNDVNSTDYKTVIPMIKGQYDFGKISEIFPKEINKDIILAIENFGTKIKGFDMDDAILCAVESRTSSPVRILRDENLQSSIEGVFPCGEGAGYAGGILSAAVDGIKIANYVIISR